MQSFETNYSELEDITVNEMKSRLALLGIEMDFHKHTNEFYRKKYMDLIQDPNNRQTLRRYGIWKSTEDNFDEKLTNKKRQRGNLYLKLDNDEFLEKNAYINGHQNNHSDGCDNEHEDGDEEDIALDDLNDGAVGGRNSGVRILTHNPRISKCAASQANPESRKTSEVNKKEIMRRVNTMNSNVRQFTPMNKAEDVTPRKSHSGLNSIGVSKVVIEDNHSETNESFEVKDATVIIPVKRHTTKTRFPRQPKRFDLGPIYKIAAVIGLSLVGYGVYTNPDASKIVKDLSITGLTLMQQGFNAAAPLLQNSEVVKYVLIGGIVVVILFVFLRKINEINKQNYDLIADNCVLRVEGKLRDYAKNDPDVCFSVAEELQQLGKVFDLSKKIMNDKIYPRMNQMIKDGDVIEEVNTYTNGILNSGWKLK
jgi:hypothetical protein